VKLPVPLELEKPVKLPVPVPVKLENPVKLLIPPSVGKLVKLENVLKLAVENPLPVPIEKLPALLPPPHAPALVYSMSSWAQTSAAPIVASDSHSLWEAPVM
jgi:hypothetical protein